jgi:tetratricopeptide (TPR) repeat protein
MSSIIEGYSYDVFISYRQKDNKGDRWVTEFAESLKTELESTFKEEINVYIDINPRDGLLETHEVGDTLKEKLKCLVFIPVISKTYCDPKSFAWQYEFMAFIEQASKDQFGLKVKLLSGNIASRVLPVRIHDLDFEDQKLCENALGGVMRFVDFIYRSPGVNRPLRAVEEHSQDNLNKIYYRDQINKVANAIEEIIRSMKSSQAWLGEKKWQFRETIEENIDATGNVPGIIDIRTVPEGSGFNQESKISLRYFRLQLKFSKFKKYIYTILVIAPLIALIFGWKDLARITGIGNAKREQARIHAINAKQYCDNNQLEDAKREVALALNFEPKNSAAWTTLAAVSCKEGNLNEAIKNTLEALTIDPSNKIAAYNLAYAFDDKQDNHQAIEWYSKAIKIDSSFVEAYSALGRLYNLLNQPADAILILNLAKSKYPGSKFLYLIYKNLGNAYLLENIYEDAIKYLELSISTKSDEPETNLFLARAYEGSGKMNKSIESWQNYINIETDSVKIKEAKQHLKEITIKHLQEILK